jgi:hypothetical protein
VEGAKAVKEFGIRARGGFFEDAATSQYADAVLDAACGKMLLLQFVRDVEGSTLVEACIHCQLKLLVLGLASLARSLCMVPVFNFVSDYFVFAE